MSSGSSVLAGVDVRPIKVDQFEMSDPKIIKDKNRLHKLAPVAAAEIRHHVFVCGGKSCSKVGASEVKKAFVKELESRKLRYGKESKGRNPEGPILLTDCGSVGFCSIGTAVLVYPEGVWYAQVRASDVPEIIEQHLIQGEPVERLVLKTPQTIGPE
ncbi:MAG: (2Fe-2S) ferredoxin domain-containing protein [Pyrinomonadaceae bacterium]|nr:(2Fe-2S) ferredoxin domain-containing protein [Pyrinomonadaceae bacterium]